MLTRIGAPLLALTLLVRPVIAAEAPKGPAVDMTQVLQDGKNKAIPDDLAGRADEERRTDPRCEKCAALTLGKAVAAALRYSTTQADRDIANNAMEKAIRSHLADVVEEDKAAQISAHDVEMIKKALNVTPYNGATAEAILRVIDPNGLAKALAESASK